MSTALSHLGPIRSGLFFGDDGGGYDYAGLLEEQFGPARAATDSLEELFEAVEWLLTGEDNPDDSPMAGFIDPA